MQTALVVKHEALGASMLDEIRRTAEQRLRQIEPLIAEAEQLRSVLEVIGGRTSGIAAGQRAHEIAAEVAPRAAKGANKRLILELVRERPGITAAEISAETGVKRTVVASTVSRLKRQGDLRDHERGGVCVTAKLTVAADDKLVGVN